MSLENKTQIKRTTGEIRNRNKGKRCQCQIQNIRRNKNRLKQPGIERILGFQAKFATSILTSVRKNIK